MSVQKLETADYVIDPNLKDKLEGYRLIKTFTCGDNTLDAFYHKGLKRALKSENVAAIGVINDAQQVIGFCTLTFAFIDRANVIKHLNKSNQPPQVPAVKLSMIAIDEPYQRKGIGSELLIHAFEKAAHVHRAIPLKGVYLDAATDAVGFYIGLGFKILEDASNENGTTPMFLPMNEILNALMLANHPSPLQEFN